MKQFIVFISIFFIGFSASAQLTTTKFKVSGKCGMCKKKIESAAIGSGVKKATWNKNKQLLEVQYDSAKVDIAKVKKAIADAGYDADGVTASEEVYNGLPECCKYRSANTPECSGKSKCNSDKKCCKGSGKACCSKDKDGKCEKDEASCCKKSESGKKKCCKE